MEVARGRIPPLEKTMAGRDTEREQRLAAKLRENLRRRKEQTKARAATGDKPQADTEPEQGGAAPSLKPDSDSDS